MTGDAEMFSMWAKEIERDFRAAEIAPDTDRARLEEKIQEWQTKMAENRVQIVPAWTVVSGHVLITVYRPASLILGGYPEMSYRFTVKLQTSQLPSR